MSDVTDLLVSVGGKQYQRGPDPADIAWNFGIYGYIGAPQGTPLFADVAGDLAGSGAGKVVLLYQAARDVMGQDLDPGPQKIGDCVSWMMAGDADLLACVQAKLGLEEFSWDMRAATEALYALSRVEIGGQRGSYSDGSTGDWAAEAVKRFGVLSRKQLGEYDPRRAKEWGAKGLPDELEPEARKHPIKTTTLVTTYEQARDAIANGYPVGVCSNVGFQTGSGGAATRRDSQGFSKPRGSWSHAMKFVAADDRPQRPGLLLMQSWGVTGSADGPKGEYDIPEHSWWVDVDVVNRMLGQRDSYAYSGFTGYPAKTIPWTF